MTILTAFLMAVQSPVMCREPFTGDTISRPHDVGASQNYARTFNGCNAMVLHDYGH